MIVPVNVYWKKVKPNFWINVAGSSRGSARVTQPARKLGKARLPLRQPLTTLFEHSFGNATGSLSDAIRTLVAMRVIPLQVS